MNRPFEELLPACQAHDPRAQAALAARYRAFIACVLRRYASAADVDDLYVEVLRRALRALGSFQGSEAGFRGWLARISRNVALSFTCRQRRREPARARSAPEPASAPEDQADSILERCERRRRVCDALAALPPEFREAIEHVVIRERSYEEAGAVVGCPIGTLKSRVSRGRRLLALHLQDLAA